MIDLLIKAKFPIGTIHQWSDGNHYKKISDDKWSLISKQSPSSEKHIQSKQIEPHAQKQVHGRAQSIYKELSKIFTNLPANKKWEHALESAQNIHQLETKHRFNKQNQAETALVPLNQQKPAQDKDEEYIMEHLDSPYKDGDELLGDFEDALHDAGIHVAQTSPGDPFITLNAPDRNGIGKHTFAVDYDNGKMNVTMYERGNQIGEDQWESPDKNFQWKQSKMSPHLFSATLSLPAKTRLEAMNSFRRASHWMSKLEGLHPKVKNAFIKLSGE